MSRFLALLALWTSFSLTGVAAEGQKFTFGDRFDYGTIRAVDYPDFRGKVYRKPCDMCSMRDPDHKGHAERMP